MSSDIRKAAEQLAGKEPAADAQPARDASAASGPAADAQPARDASAAGSPAAFPAAEGRDVAAVLNPSPITVIGARDEAGRIGFATVLWVTPISHKPPMVAFALRPQSHTMGIIQKTGAFSLSTFPANAESVQIIEACGYKSGHNIDKGVVVDHALLAMSDSEADGGRGHGACEDHAPKTTPNAIEATGAKPQAGEGTQLLPVPLHAFSWELCEVESIQEAGDHLLVIGRVLRAASKAARDDKGRLYPTETMLCIQHGAYASAGENI